MGIETALLGSTLASATAGASTVGLIGAGGVLAPTMGSIAAGLSSLGGLTTALSVGSSLFSGVQQMQAGNQQAASAYSQAGANIAEQTRQATQQAYQEKQAAEGARRQQKLAYLKSGVSLSGSPLMVLEETRQKGLANANAIMSSNTAYTSAAGTQAKYQAKDAISQGRMGFIKGVTGALSQYAN